MTVRGRFAPSPTGRLHLGNAKSALLGWLSARAQGGEFLLRIEDLDPERSKSALVDMIYRDLEYLGLDWDGPVVFQSQRQDAYRAALEKLLASGRAYPCACSRADIARLASAPHAGEEGPRYPGTCRGGAQLKPGRAPSHRFRVAPGVVTFEDAVVGAYSQDVDAAVGDFVLQRHDGVASYQLAVVVDDAYSGITEVLRAEDLLASTPRQIQLNEALGFSIPRYAHVPLLLGDDGERLAKRAGAVTVSAFREAGVRAERVVGLLAQWSGLGEGAPCSARELLAGFSVAKVMRGAARVDEGELVRLLGG
ncbi:MAG: tRNA glutamyl-Q(34) synthetase GluQRS [Myxococcaceae bacterium]|nr:tRNA glutamyl-Q(34) synthetase GluQRS [Myxococcaceae bacterium]